MDLTETDDIAIRRARADDLPYAVEFLRLCLGEGTVPRNEAYWRWKHEKNPFGASPVLLAEADEQQIVGLRAFLRWTWQCGDRHVPAVRAVDTATHPDWRGRGIFTRLTLRLVEEMKEEGVAFVFNTPNEKSRPGYLKMGWETVGRVNLWVRPRRPLRGLRRLLSAQDASHTPDPLSDVFGSVDALLSAPTLGAFLTGCLPQDRRYHTPRTTQYLRWRYAQIPGFTYRTLWHFDSAGGAVAIFRTRMRHGLVELDVSELLVSPTRTGLRRGRSLIRKLAKETRADYLVAMAPDALSRHALLFAGFVPAPRLGPYLTARPLKLGALLPDPANRASWRLSAGDLELF